MKRNRPRGLLSPIDRIVRLTIGFMILVFAYTLSLPTLDFAELHMVTVYLWVTVMVSWDPFYAIVHKIRKMRYEERVMSGKF